MKSHKIVYFFLILLIAAICFSPRFSVGYVSFTKRSIDIRAEDIILALGLFFSIIFLLANGKITFKKPPLFWPIIAWICLGFFSILINAIAHSVNASLFFFYFLKELEFFVLYFLVFSWLSSLQKTTLLLKYWILGCLIDIGWLLYVFFAQVEWSSYYGPNIFTEPQGPFPSGGFFLILFIFLFNIYLFYWSKLLMPILKKGMLLTLSLIPAFGVLFSGSYTAIVGLLFSVILSLLIYFARKMSIARLTKISLVFFLIIIIGIQFINAINFSGRISKGKFLWEYTSNQPLSRIGILNQNINLITHDSPFRLLIGFGIFGEAHSYYMRVFLERGILGLVLFFWLIASILSISFHSIRTEKDSLSKGLSSGLFIATLAMLVMAVPNDAFMVVKVDEVYWFFAAMTMVAISNPHA